MNNAQIRPQPLIIPIFIPHMGCPHQCVFCNQRSITGISTKIPSAERIQYQVEQFLRFGKRRYSTTEVSFFGGNFLGLSRDCIHSLMNAVETFIKRGIVDSVRFSTRPDTVDPHTLDMIANFSVSTVELGAQSMNDQVLNAAGRGHCAADTVQAVGLLKEKGYQVGLQMMVGLPKDDDTGALETARRIADLQPDFVRIYPTIVIKGSALAGLLRAGSYNPLSLEECVTLVKRIYLLFQRHHIPVVRMGLQASDGLKPGADFLAGPYHPAFGHLVYGEIAYDAISGVLDKMDHRPTSFIIESHPSMVSRVQGLGKKNIRRLKQVFGIPSVTLIQNADLAKNRLIVGGRRIILP